MTDEFTIDRGCDSLSNHRRYDLDYVLSNKIMSNDTRMKQQ